MKKIIVYILFSTMYLMTPIQALDTYSTPTVNIGTKNSSAIEIVEKLSINWSSIQLGNSILASTLGTVGWFYTYNHPRDAAFYGSLSLYYLTYAVNSFFNKGLLETTYRGDINLSNSEKEENAYQLLKKAADFSKTNRLMSAGVNIVSGLYWTVGAPITKEETETRSTLWGSYEYKTGKVVPSELNYIFGGVYFFLALLDFESLSDEENLLKKYEINKANRDNNLQILSGLDNQGRLIFVCKTPF